MVTEVELNMEERRATVSVPEDQQSLAIGKEGQNARLANKLTKWKIDIKGAVGIFSQAVSSEPTEKVEKTVKGIWDEEIQIKKDDDARNAANAVSAAAALADDPRTTVTDTDVTDTPDTQSPVSSPEEY